MNFSIFSAVEEWERGRVGERKSGRAEEWERGSIKDILMLGVQAGERERGEWESRRGERGEWESGRVGERERGEWESGKTGGWESGRVGERQV